MNTLKKTIKEPFVFNKHKKTIDKTYNYVVNVLQKQRRWIPHDELYLAYKSMNYSTALNYKMFVLLYDTIHQMITNSSEFIPYSEAK